MYYEMICKYMYPQCDAHFKADYYLQASLWLGDQVTFCRHLFPCFYSIYAKPWAAASCMHACMRVAVACLFFPHRRPWSSTARACQIGRTRTWSRIGTRSRARIAFASAAGIAEWFRCTAWSLSFHFTSLQRMWCEWSGGDAWCHSAILVHVFARASLGR